MTTSANNEYGYVPVVEHVEGVGPVLQGLPSRPRMRALTRVVPDTGMVAAWGAGIAGVVVGDIWWLVVALLLAVYHLVLNGLVGRYAVPCETADHWIGDDRPEALVEQCPYCTDIPLRELWRGGRR